MPLTVDQIIIDALDVLDCYVGWSYGEEATIGQTLANPYIFHRGGKDFISCSVDWGYGWGDSGTITFTVSNDKQSAFYTGWNQPYDYLTFNIELASANVFQLDASKLNDIDAAEMVLRINGVPAVVDDWVEVGDTLTLVAKSGFAVSSARIRGVDDWGYRTDFDFIINDPPTTATLLVEPSLKGFLGYTINAASMPYTPAVEGSNRVYKITPAILEEVNDQRFAMSGGSAVDFGEYILGLIKLPFDIDPAEIGDDAAIQLGELTLTVEAPTVRTDKLSVTLGTIETPAPNGNTLDYINTKCTLHLPYTKSLDLEPIYVVGETIGIEYIIDLYSGKTTINISSSKLGGEVFQSQTADLGIEIPYIATRSTANLDNPSISVGGDNHIRTPFIEIIRSDSTLPNGFFTAPIEVEGSIAQYTGYAEGIDIELLTAASLAEKQDIVSKLKSGVIIK